MESKEIIKFKCKGEKCKSHCCGAFSGVSSSLTPISGIKMTEIILIPSDAEKIRNYHREDLIEKLDNGIEKIKTFEDGTCYALKNGKCEIYEARPAICKAYPLYIDMFTGINFINECDAFNFNINMEEYKNELKALLDIYQFWIDYLKNKME